MFYLLLDSRVFLVLVKIFYFSYDVGISIKDAVKEIAGKLDIKERDLEAGQHLSQWLYIFTKGYVSNLRSRRALPNDYWTAETVEDYMRCKVINFPIGVHNEEMRRDAFRTWIISKKMADEREKDKKNLFVVTYNPVSCEVKFVNNICLNVETKVETLGLLEHINLGTVRITDTFFNHVNLVGAKVTVGDRIFIRRIFPIQNESDERLEKLIVSEAKIGENLTHIDDCHVLVIQEGGHGAGLDYDKFIISKIREIKVRFEHRHEAGASDLDSVDMALDPKVGVETVIKRLSEVVRIAPASLELFKCYSTKSMMKRPAEFPVDVETERNLESLLEWCKEGVKTVYFRHRTESRRSTSTPAPPAQAFLHSPRGEPSLMDRNLNPVPREEKPESEVCLSVEEDIMDTA